MLLVYYDESFSCCVNQQVKLKLGLKIAMSLSNEGNAYLQVRILEIICIHSPITDCIYCCIIVVVFCICTGKWILEAFQERFSFMLDSDEGLRWSSLSSSIYYGTFYATFFYWSRSLTCLYFWFVSPLWFVNWHPFHLLVTSSVLCCLQGFEATQFRAWKVSLFWCWGRQCRLGKTLGFFAFWPQNWKTRAPIYWAGMPTFFPTIVFILVWYLHSLSRFYLSTAFGFHVERWSCGIYEGEIFWKPSC